VSIDPGIQISLIEAPTFIDADPLYPIADRFLFEAVPV
jgi:hypothetical protein